jgi:CHRD domain
MMSYVRKIQKMPLWTWVLAGFVAWAMVACGGSDDNTAPPVAPIPTSTTTVFTVSLSGNQEVPSTTTSGAGTGSLTFASPSLAISGGITVGGITATAAHIHTGVAGTNGGVIVPLTESPAGSGNWIVPTGQVLTQAQADALLAGGLYFNAHTTANPGGDIRGQIGRTVFAVNMSPSQEVPSNASTATGKGLLVLDPVTKKFTASITVTGMTATAAHIHTGFAGTNGGVIFPFTETAPGSGVLVAAADASMTDAQIVALNAGGLYFNAHSAAYPGGEVRGQIGRDVFAVEMTPAQEVPSNTTTASAKGLLVLDPVTKKFTSSITVTGMTATAAHIHTAAAGSNGPVTFPLTETAPGSGVLVAAADASMTDAQIATLKAGGMYFNAHSAAFPGGQVRGQIR